MVNLIKNIDVEQLAVNGHIPRTDAVYIIADLDNKDFMEISAENIKKDREMLIKDYFSQLISINKSVDKKKQIQSNNKYTMFIKKIEILTEEQLKDYYNVLECPDLEQKKYINWLLQNKSKLSKFAGRLIKIFFPATTEEYRSEGRKYFKSRIFSDMQHTEHINGVEMGAPITINANYKKPFLLSNPTKSKFPVMHTAEDCYKIKCLLDVFKNLLNTGHDKVYLVDNKFIPIRYGHILQKQITSAVFFSFKFGERGEVLITGWQSIPVFYVDFDSKNIMYYYLNINNLFFDGNLYSILVNGSTQKNIGKEAKMLTGKLYNWFILGQSPDYMSLKYISKWLCQIIKNNLEKDYDLCIKSLYFLKELKEKDIEM